MKAAKITFSRVVVLCVVSFLAGAGPERRLCAEVQAAGLAEVFIDFDHLPDGSATGSGPVGDDYAEWGVRFQTIGVDTSKSPTYSRFLHDSRYANCGACSYPPGYNIAADFDVPVYRISAHVTCVAGETVTMIAKDVRGIVLGSITSPLVSVPYTFVGPIEVTSDTPIASVEWWPSRSTSRLGLDDVRILVADASPPGGGQTDGPGHLVAYWDFNEGQGNIAYDVSGHGNHGSLSGPVGWVAGYEGTALSFTGVDGHVRVENSPELNPTEALTVAAWISPVWTGNNRIVQKDGHDNQYRLLKEHGDNMVFDLAGVTNGRLEHHGLPPSREWTHMAATYDGSAMKLYYNAEVVDSHSASGVIHTSAEPLTIGSKHPGAPLGDEYRGSMDELRIYDRALTRGQVQALMEWTPSRGVQITDVKIMRGEFIADVFQEIEEVDRVRVGDLFQIVVEVSNLGGATETVGNLYTWDTSGQGRMEITGRPCVGFYLVDLDPGESALLYPFCPLSQAFEATASGRVDMDIVVSEDCQDAFGFDIAPASDGGLEVTDVKIMLGEFVEGRFQERAEVDHATMGDLFQVVVEVTNRGDTVETVGNLYAYELSGQGSAEVVGHLCLGVYLIDLAPGESALLDAFCPGTQAFEAREAGSVTMNISVDLGCHHVFTFEIVPATADGVEVTDVMIIGGELVGGWFQPTGEVSEVTVGDVFQVAVEVTNFGDTTQYTTNLYHEQVHPESRLALVGHPSVCLANITLEPGESTVLYPYCPGYAYEAQEVGWVTMDIDVRDWGSVGWLCSDTFTFEIGPATADGVQVTDVMIIGGELGEGGFQSIGEVSEVTVGDVFQVAVEVTNFGDTTYYVHNLYDDQVHPESRLVVVGGPSLCLHNIALEPGESILLYPYCPGYAYEAQEGGWVTMDIEVTSTVGWLCSDTFTFEIGSG